MFANFTEETCTGTGTTLALAGATAGAIPFSASFADGDLVSYVVEDSGGSIKVAGVGTYVSATDDITRNDTWNYNGTVVDKNPSANIALSAGVHTIRCDVVERSFVGSAGRVDYSLLNNTFLAGDNIAGFGVNATATVDRLQWYEIVLLTETVITEVGLDIASGQIASNTRAGVYKVRNDGSSSDLVRDFGLIDTSATGRSLVTLSPTLLLPPGRYMIAFVSDQAITFRGVTAASRIGSGGQGNSNYNPVLYYKNAAHTGVLPAELVFEFWRVSAANAPVVFWR